MSVGIMTVEEQIYWVSSKLAKHFKDDPKKIGLWILTKNPLFGGVSAAEMFALNRGHKVVQFMQAALDGNVA